MKLAPSLRLAPLGLLLSSLLSTGCPGSSDASGSAGTTGTAGTTGSAGTTGNAGTTGTAGVSGNAGTTGTAGVSGSAGTTGTAGVSGNAGTTGSAGRGGATGTAGTTGSGGSATCPTANEDKFSFFLISNAELIRQGGADSTGMFSKFGGNLGGIVGADKICQTAAERVSPCQTNKVWHAFLSTTTVNAIDRIGTGPWYDRNGRLWSANLTNLVGDRPTDADPAIKNDPPNENGVRNQNPDGTGNVDNHETLTGTGANGRVYTQSTGGGGASGGGGSTSCGPDVGATTSAWSPERATCWNWTRNTPEGCPRVGHSWCSTPSCTPAGSGSGTNWMSVWNEGGCAPGGTLVQNFPMDDRRVGAWGGYGGFFCFAVIPHP